MRELQENVSFRKSTVRTMADGECFTSDKYQFYHFIQLRLSFNAQLKSCVLCEASVITQDGVNFCTLVCIPHLRLIYCLDHYFFFKKKLYLFIYLFILYLFLAVLCLRFCARAFSSCGERGPFPIAVRGPLHYRGLSCCGAQAPDAQAQ